MAHYATRSGTLTATLRVVFGYASRRVRSSPVPSRCRAPAHGARVRAPPRTRRRPPVYAGAWAAKPPTLEKLPAKAKAKTTATAKAKATRATRGGGGCATTAIDAEQKRTDAPPGDAIQSTTSARTHQQHPDTPSAQAKEAKAHEAPNDGDESEQNDADVDESDGA